MLTEFSEALAYEEAARLTERLSALKSEWLSEPSLHTLSPRTVDALLRRFAEVERILQPATGVEELFSLLLLLISSCVVVFAPELPLLLKVTSAACVALPALYGLFCAWRGFRMLARGKWMYIVYALTQTDDLRALETLIPATRYRQGRHPEVIKAINRLLQQVTEADAGVLSQKMQNRLWDWAVAPIRLGSESNEALAVSALQAFVHIGSRETLARMQKFTHETAPYAALNRVVALIEQLIPVMEERLQRQEVPQTLLRASNISDAPPETLLRAAHTATNEPAAQLLRVVTTEMPADERISREPSRERPV